jgi:twinkle protein
MNPKELNQKLVDKIEAALHYLYKDTGKFSAGRFSIGNASGDDGDSLFVYLKDGRFKDVATGERGDILELFSLKYGSKQSGIDAAYSFLGIPRPMKHTANKDIKELKKVIPWQKPEKDWSQLTENPAVLDYLINKRRISQDVIEGAGIRGRDDSLMVFLTYTHDALPVVCGANYIGIKRMKNKKTGKIKKPVFQSDKPLATLYGHTSCPVNKDGFLVITEGQIDCLSFRSQGIKNCVSVPFGAGALGWIENSWEWMMQFKEIYLCFDNDDAGQKNLDKAAKQIGYDKCRKVPIPGQYNDANDAHMDGYDLHKCIDAAQEFKPAKLVSTLELAEEALVRVSAGRRELRGIPFLDWCNNEEAGGINFRIRPKEWTIYTGYPGSGKSNILYQLVAFLIFVKKQKVVIASLEEDAEDILNLIICHALAMQYNKDIKQVHDAWIECYRVLDQQLFFYYHRNRAPFKEVLETAEYTIRKHGAQHFILDSVAKTDLNIEDNKEANEFVNMITTSMNQTHAHYHVVAHSRKGDDKNYEGIPGLQEIKGAAAFGIECFNCITIWRNKAKQVLLEQARKWQDKGGFKSRHGEKIHTVESLYDKEDSLLIINKQKVGGQVGQHKLYYDADTYRMCNNPQLTEEPYATEIYEHYITNKGQRVEEADF